MSVIVNCWYCSEDSFVPADCTDSWECTKCDQFNSFTSDGDATAVTAGAQPRRVRYNVAVQPAATVVARWQLCYHCNLQQQLKARQLAEFRPVLEHRWDEELDDYQRHLESVHQPCSHCQAVVASALREADDRVRPAWLAWRQQQQQQQPAAEAGGPTAGPALSFGSRLGRLAAAARRITSQLGGTVRGGAVKLCRMLGAGLALLLPAGLFLLLVLLLCSSCLLNFQNALVPNQYQSVLLELRHVFSENKAALVLFCFTLWVFTMSRWTAKTLVGLSLWTAMCAVELSMGKYVGVGAAGPLQAVFVLALLLLFSGRVSPTGRGLPAVATPRSDPSAVLKRMPSSSTPQTSPNGTAGSRPCRSANGHAPAASPIPARPPTPPTQADYDYNLPRLSLGSPRKSAGAGGVFALRTYQPASGASLFSGVSQRPTPLLSPSRLRSELHHSAWIAGGYWQQGQATPVTAAQQLMSRSSSQSSGFVDAPYGPSSPAAVGSVLGEDDPRSWAGSQYDVRSCTGDTWTHAPSCLAAAATGRPPERSCGPLAAAMDSSSLLSDRSLTSQRTAVSGLSEPAVRQSSVLLALVLGFSMAFNMFALLLLLYRDRL